MTNKIKKLSLLIFSTIFTALAVLSPFFAVKTTFANSVNDSVIPPYLYVTGTSNAYVFSNGLRDNNSIETTYTELSLPKFVNTNSTNTLNTDMLITGAQGNSNTYLVSALYRSYPRYAFYFNYRGYVGTFDESNPLLTLKLEDTFLPYDLIYTYVDVSIIGDERVGVSVSYDIIPIDNNYDIYGDYTYAQPYHFDTFFDYAYTYDLILYNGGVQKPTEERVQSFSALFPTIQHFYVKDLTIKFYPRTYTPSITTNRAIILDFRDSLGNLTYISYEEYSRANSILYSKALPNVETNVGGLLMSPLQAFLRLEIFPNFYVWTLVSIALALAVTGFMIGVLKNG